MRSNPAELHPAITISVVIPVYNDAEFLRTCLRALAQQRRPADEIIVVDNGSTDATAAIAQAAGVRLVSEPLRGIWPAAAAGYDAASGDIIARLDADSVAPVDWLDRIDERFSRVPDTAALTGPGDFYGSGPATAWLGGHVYIGGYFIWMGLWLGHPPLFGSNFAMRRQVWARHRTEVRRTRNDVHDDLDFSMHLAADEPVTLDRSLRVAISARPFETPQGLGRRIRWAGRTLFSGWPEFSPWRIRSAARRLRQPHDRQTHDRQLHGRRAHGQRPRS